MKNKIIIHNYTKLNDLEALKCIEKVVKIGEISRTSKGNQYCFITKFAEGYIVGCDKKNNTYTFKIIEEEWKTV